MRVAVPKSVFTTSTRYSGITTLYRILPAILVAVLAAEIAILVAVLAAEIAADRASRAITANENYTKPSFVCTRKTTAVSSKTISCKPRATAHHVLIHDALDGRRAVRACLTCGFNPPDGHACRGLCDSRLHGICAS